MRWDICSVVSSFAFETSDAAVQTMMPLLVTILVGPAETPLSLVTTTPHPGTPTPVVLETSMAHITIQWSSSVRWDIRV